MRFLVLGLSVLAMIPACAGEDVNTAVQGAQVKASLDSLWTSYADAADRRDRVGLGALFAEDASVAFSNEPTVRGRAGIEEFLTRRYSGFDLTALRVTPEDLRVGGTIAAQGGTFEEDFTQDGAAKTEVGRFALVAERGPDGVWRIRRLTALADSVRSR